MSERGRSERHATRAPSRPLAPSAPASTLENILASAVDNIFASDREFRYVYVSPSAARLLGKSAAELVGKRWEEVHPPAIARLWKRLAQQVVHSREPLRDEASYTGTAGERVYEYIMHPVLDASGEVELVVTIARDVTQRKKAEGALALANIVEQRARMRATRLHEVAAALSLAETRDDVAGVIVNQAFEALGAESAVAYFSEGEDKLVLGAARGVAEAALRGLRLLPLTAPLPLAEAARMGEPIWLESREALLERYPAVSGAETPEQRLQAVAAVPLQSGEQTLGALAFSFSRGRAFDEDERRFLLTLANHAALASERCRLRQEREAAQNRLAVLAEASRRFSEAKLELRDTLDTIARELAHRLRETCAITLLSPDEEVLEVAAVASVDPEQEQAVRQTLLGAPLRMGENSVIVRAIKAGESILAPQMPPETWIASTARPEYREHLARFPISTLLVAPLRARGNIIGAITIARGASGPSYSAQDEVLLRDLADRAGLAIANARQFEELRLRRQRLDVLAKASETLAKSLDYETTLRNVVELALPTLGDFGFFDVIEPSGEVRRLALAYEDPERQALLAQTRWVRSQHKEKNLCALSSGTPGFHPRIDEAWLRDVAASPEHLELMRKLSFGSMITVPLSYHESTLGALTLFFSAAHRRHSEGDVRLAQELARRAAAALENARLFKESREAIAIRDDFLSIASHELNTPLTALQLQLQSLKRQAEKEGISDWFRERLMKTEGQVGRIEKLVTELLDVSRLTTGRLRIELEPLDLAQTLREVIERLSPHASAARCALVYVGADHIPGQWDRLRIEQVVTNLISNSIKYGPGHPIEVHASVVSDVARVTVRDFGIGVSPDDEERIFGRFERAVSQRHYGGLGLGLWIARQIVEEHGGSIRLERPDDVGAKFVIELPLGN